MRDVGYRKGPSRTRTEDTMLVFLTLEATQPSGTSYRLAIGCLVHPKVASIVAVIMRLI